MQPAEKTRNDNLFNALWATKYPIEELFDRLEKCFVFAMISRPPYTQKQLVDKALLAIQLTGAFELATQEWIGFTEENKTWHQLKVHFTEVYGTHLGTGAGTTNMTGYHGAVIVMDNNSLWSITQIIGQI